MLVISRCKGGSITLIDSKTGLVTEIKVLNIGTHRAVIGVQADPSITVLRTEVFEHDVAQGINPIRSYCEVCGKYPCSC